MGQQIDSKFGGYVAIPVGVANLNSSLTNGTMALVGGNVAAVVPFSGSIVGVSVQGNAGATAGTAAFVPVINGVQTTLKATISTAAANTSKAYAVSPVGELKFAAGAALGVEAVTSTTFAATTIEYDAVLYIQLDNN
jgi:hypothetical protein